MLQVNSTDAVTIEKLPNASGYDGHCLRAYAYFKQHMPDITDALNQASSEKEKVEIINSIAAKHKELRQKSKAPTFALT